MAVLDNSLGSTLIFFCKKKKRVLLYAAEWFHPIDGSVRQLSGEYPHFFLQVLGVPSSFLHFKEEGNFFLCLQIYQFLQTELPILEAPYRYTDPGLTN